MKEIIFLTILISIFSCSSKDNSTSKTDNEKNEITVKKITNADFEEFLNYLDFIEFPYQTACFSNYEINNSIDEELILKFADNKLEYPYKRIYTPRDFEIVLFLSTADILIPTIRTYKLNGEIIDSEQMFFGYCGGEPGYYHTEYIQIKSDKLITHSDSTWTNEVDEDFNDIPNTKKLKYDTYDFIINDEGIISKKE